MKDLTPLEGADRVGDVWLADVAHAGRLDDPAGLIRRRLAPHRRRAELRGRRGDRRQLLDGPVDLHEVDVVGRGGLVVLRAGAVLDEHLVPRGGQRVRHVARGPVDEEHAACCIGYAVASVLDSVDTAQPAIQLTTLPLYIISGIWVPTDSLSDGLRQVAKIFPVEHLSALLHQAYVPGTTGGHVAGGDLLVLAAWAAAAALFAARRFSWLPAPA
jgi:ABC-2 family transporter protein